MHARYCGPPALRPCGASSLRSLFQIAPGDLVNHSDTSPVICTCFFQETLSFAWQRSTHACSLLRASCPAPLRGQLPSFAVPNRSRRFGQPLGHLSKFGFWVPVTSHWIAYSHPRGARLRQITARCNYSLLFSRIEPFGPISGIMAHDMRE